MASALAAPALFLPYLALAQAGSQVVAVAPHQTLSAKRGGTVSDVLEVHVQSGFHVNSDHPRDEFLIPLKLSWTNGPLEARRTVYPTAEQVKVGDQTVDVFTGKFAIKTEFAVRQGVNPGLTMMEGKLHYQACDDRSCKRPATINVQIPVSVQ